MLSDKTNVRGQEPITLSSNSEPEPDVVIAKKKADNYLAAHPTAEDIILVIEILNFTLKYDRETKLTLYAEAEINNYWIINLVDRHLEAYRNPFADSQGNFNYRNKSTILPNEKIDIPNFSEVILALSTVFP